jgi:cystine transport system ATP-binding protein
MVMATHDLRLASKIATSVVFLEAGNIVETGPSRAIFGAPTQERTKQFISTLNAGHTYDI